MEEEKREGKGEEIGEEVEIRGQDEIFEEISNYKIYRE